MPLSALLHFMRNKLCRPILLSIGNKLSCLQPGTLLKFIDRIIEEIGNNSDSTSRLFHWVATLGKLFTLIESAVSQLQETGVQKESFRRLSGYGD